MRSVAKLLVPVLVGASAAAAQSAGPITAVAADGVTIHGELYFGELDADAPLVLLFHQGGSNG